jgi:FKBP-type peptidyl-prolyl cis-trans isomerase FkpA
VQRFHFEGCHSRQYTYSRLLLMKNKVLSFLLCTVIISMLGCIKGGTASGGCTDKLVTSEAAAIEAYANTNGITASAHSSGIYYQVINPGTGVTATSTSKIFVKYTGRFITNNNIFDEQNNSTLTGWTLGGLIPGWQIGIPLIKEGGTIKLIIPSSLAYGCRGYNTIPGDAVLYFQIELVDVQ